MIGRTLSHYRITAKLGTGGMGEVYLAEDTKLERRVALKVLPAELADDPDRLRRLQREARALAALDHPNIVTVFSVEESDGVHFLTMAHVEGEGLDELIPPEGFSAERLLEVAAPLADALRAAHEHGIVHRDLKPANIMIDREDRLRVLDFGLARLEGGAASEDMSRLATRTMTRAGTVLGTYPYMSPEQAQGEIADARSDLFSLGVILYEMATGRRPFTGETGVSLISSILKDTPTPVTDVKAGLPEELGSIIERCLEKDPDERFSSAGELRDRLQALRRQVRDGRAAVSAAAARPRRLTLVTALVATAAILAGLYAWISLSGSGPPSDAARLEAAAPGISSLAVLPLENFTGDADGEYFVDGMTDALITGLSQVGSLAVISRTTAMRYKGTDKTLPAIARDLNVDNVIEGSVARTGEQVQIKVQLIDASTDRATWSDTFEGELAGVLALQAEVAKAIASAVRVALTAEEETRLTDQRRVNPESYQAYLRGMYWLNKGTPEGIGNGMKFLHEAVEKDPGDPLAYAGLAIGYITVAHGPEPPPDALHQARSAARKAVRLDDALAEAHAALAFLQGYYDWDWELAQKTLDHALDINPSLAIAHYHNAWYHALFGRMEEAIAAHRRAQELDPLMPLHTAWLGELYRLEGRYEEAIAEATRSIEMAPGFPVGHLVLGNVYQDRGLHDDALAAYERAAEAAPSYRWALGRGYAKAGRTNQAREVLSELQRQPVTPWRAFWFSSLHLALGEFDEAFRWLNYEHPHAFVPWIRILPDAEPLRDDPRFSQLLERMSLPPLEG